MLLAEDDYGHIVTVHMLNDDEERSERVWHGNEGNYFLDSPAKVKAEYLKKLVQEAKSEVSKAKDALAYREKRLADLKGMAEGVQK